MEGEKSEVKLPQNEAEKSEEKEVVLKELGKIIEGGEKNEKTVDYLLDSIKETPFTTFRSIQVSVNNLGDYLESTEPKYFRFIEDKIENPLKYPSEKLNLLNIEKYESWFNDLNYWPDSTLDSDTDLVSSERQNQIMIVPAMSSDSDFLLFVRHRSVQESMSDSFKVVGLFDTDDFQSLPEKVQVYLANKYRYGEKEFINLDITKEVQMEHLKKSLSLLIGQGIEEIEVLTAKKELILRTKGKVSLHISFEGVPFVTTRNE